MRRILAITLALLVAAAVLGATAFREELAHAAPAILNVFVTNDAAHPVPVAVTGQPVSVSDASETVQLGTFAFFDPAETRATGDFEIPSGKRLNVHYVNALDSYGPELQAVHVDSFGSSQFFFPAVTDQPGPWEVVSEEVSASLEGTVRVEFIRDVPAGGSADQGVFAYFFGTLEDAG
jgi:hypothetical protein